MRYTTTVSRIGANHLNLGNCQKGQCLQGLDVPLGGLPITWGQPALDYVTSLLASWLLSKVTVPQHGRIVVNWTDAEVINAQGITLRAF
jgi:hypothetical protein